jgi:hypothetical protein
MLFNLFNVQFINHPFAAHHRHRSEVST